MNTDEWLRKARLKYLIETYFTELSKEYIARRCRNDCTAAENERIQHHALLAVKEFHYVGQRAAVSYLELRDPPVPTHFIRVACSILVREYALGHALPLDVEHASNRITAFVMYGEGSPLAILSNQVFPVQELSFEHKAPSGSEPFSEIILSQRATEFLRGGPPRDWDVIREVAIERPVESELIEALSSGTQLIVLTSAAGDGKSTLLKRVAMRLRETGSRVFLTEAPDRGPFPALPACMVDIPGRSYLLIDNADMAVSYPKLEDDLAAIPNLRVVLCARSYQWERKALSWRRQLEIKIPVTQPEELGKLATAVLRWRASSQAKKHEDLVEAMVRSVHGDHPHLLAAMMTATRGISFRAIIDGMIAEFEQAGEDWALRYVACGALLSELTSGKLGRLPGNIFRRLVSSHAPETLRSPDREDGARRKVLALSSEIIPLRTPTRYATTEYDLRHPDITSRILDRYFSFHWQERIDDPDAFLGDLNDIIQAEFEIRNAPLSHPLRWLRYSGAVIRNLLNAPRELYKWFSVAIMRGLTRSFLQKFTSYEDDIEVRVSILLDWARLESDLGDGEADEEREGKERMSDIILAEASSLSPNDEHIWFRRENLAAERGEIGELVNPERYTCRWLLRDCFSRGLATENIYLRWFNLEVAENNIGEFAHPAEGSARWIARTAWARDIRGEHILIAWMHFETQSGHLGSIDAPAPYSSRWIAQSDWELGGRNANLVASWMRQEAVADNLGSIQHPHEYSVRGIARAAWDAGLHWEQLTATWMNLEARSGNIGTLSEPELFSARWIAQAAWREGFRGAHLVLTWMNLERQENNVGESGEPPQFSARWIARQTWETGTLSAHFVVGWMLDESEWGNLGDAESPAKYTSLWIARAAWDAGVRDEQFVSNWMKLEAQAGHLGTDKEPSVYTAIWIGRTAWQMGVFGEQFLSTWMSLEATAGNVGDVASPAKFSSMWIAREVTKSGTQWRLFLDTKANLEGLARGDGD